MRRLRSSASLMCLFLWVLSGCETALRRESMPETARTSQPAWRTDYPSDEFDTWTVTSSDGKFHVSVVNAKSERAGGFKGSAQYRFQHDDCSRDIVRTWGARWPPYAVSYPIFTHIVVVGDGLYLVLGWTADSVAFFQLYAFLVTVEKDAMRLGKVVLNCGDPHAHLIASQDSLGLFVPNDARRDYPWELKVMKHSLTAEEFAAKAQAAPSRRQGLWYTRPAWATMPEGRGKVYWINLRHAAKHIRP